MIVLDTNVLSALMQSQPEATVVDWHVDSGFVEFSLALKQMLGYHEADIGTDVAALWG